MYTQDYILTYSGITFYIIVNARIRRADVYSNQRDTHTQIHDGITREENTSPYIETSH